MLRPFAQSVACCCVLLDVVACLLRVVACCCVLLHVVVCCCVLLRVVACCCMLLHVVACCCMLLRVVACCCVLLDVVACCCVLLHVVACCWMLLHKFETGQTLSQQLPTFLLISDRRSIQWSVCTAPPTMLRPRMRITNGLLSLLGQILHTMQCRSQQSSVCTPLPTRTQQLPTLTPNIFGPTRHPFTGYNEPIQRPAPSWLVILIGRALHRYRRGQGFESRTRLIFFRLSLRNCKSCVYNCDDHPSFKPPLRSPHI